MINRNLVILGVILLGTPSFAGLASAENKMAYQLETAEAASSLTKSGGSLGMRVGPEQTITSEGLTFELLKVEGVGQGSPAAQAGLAIGDQIIAVNGHVFPNTKTFAEFVGAVAPGQQVEIDYMPAGGGPKDAQRLGVTVGEGGRAAPAHRAEQGSGGISTGDKVAIGLGAAAIFGCYETNCISRIKQKYEEERLRHEQAKQPTASPKP